ncbi:PREDICTED: collagen alpha-1(II) chain-like [Chinchilla lanigera]|uniref:collagen alpha-1(II) chain-like n=1 Tax=Chinchilla lanigera TaxID=34839 RepID=UPI00038EBD26|nr:PREDICTED: collagen alpha-1(II) chain-like [Chinchilla lanigera]
MVTGPVAPGPASFSLQEDGEAAMWAQGAAGAEGTPPACRGLVGSLERAEPLGSGTPGREARAPPGEQARAGRDKRRDFPKPRGVGGGARDARPTRIADLGRDEEDEVGPKLGVQAELGDGGGVGGCAPGDAPPRPAPQRREVLKHGALRPAAVGREPRAFRGLASSPSLVPASGPAQGPPPPCHGQLGFLGMGFAVCHKSHCQGFPTDPELCLQATAATEDAQLHLGMRWQRGPPPPPPPPPLPRQA